MRARCQDCKGAGIYEARVYDPSGETDRYRTVEYACAECVAGEVDLDPLEDIDDDAPLVEPDAVPLSAIEQWAILTAKLGGGEQAAIDAARVLREEAA
jgi:hypothetical protein